MIEMHERIRFVSWWLSISARTGFKSELLHEISQVPSILKRIFQKLIQKNGVQKSAESIILEIPHFLLANKAPCKHRRERENKGM